IGLYVYGIGSILAVLSFHLLGMITGYSLLEGIGSALFIPPVYILATVSFPDIKERAKAFGVITAMGGIGAASGPLIGGLITTSLSWRYSFLLETILIVLVIFLSRSIKDPGLSGEKPKFDYWGTVLSALGLVSLVTGILLIKNYGLLSLPVISAVITGFLF